MKHLFREWNNIKKRIKGKHLLFLFDYDGTLAPVANSPELAILPIKTRKALASLSSIPGCTVAILSGRSANDLKHMVKLKNVIYAGNHGHEIKADHISFVVPQTKELKFALWDTYKKLCLSLDRFEGIILENKKYTLSIHYRIVNPVFEQKIKTEVNKIINTHPFGHLLQISNGKKVLEIKPAGEWNKGKAAQHMMVTFLDLPKEFTAICIGDDLTDEDLFLPFVNNGITIRVGRWARSCATYYLQNIMEVQVLLEQILAIVKPKQKNIETYTKYARKNEN